MHQIHWDTSKYHKYLTLLTMEDTIKKNQAHNSANSLENL